MNTSHANVILYDKKTNIAIRFEPYGPLNHYIKDSEDLDLYILGILRQSISDDITYKSPNDFMSNAKFQLVSGENDPENKKNGDPNGFCLSWIFWFIELKLKKSEL